MPLSITGRSWPPGEAQTLSPDYTDSKNRSSLQPWQVLSLIARTAYVLFCVVTSLYCVLAYIPFTYEQMIKSNLIPAAGAFARAHPVVQAVMTLILFWDCVRDLRRAPLLIFLIAEQIFISAACIVRPVLVDLSSTFWSLLAAIVALLPALVVCGFRCATALTAIDARNRRASISVSSFRLFCSC